MSEKTYATVAGFVQFDPQERDANNQKVRDVVVKAVGTQKLVRITIWPEHASTPVSKGDFVAADGVFTQSVGQAQDGSTREYLNLSASVLVVLPQAPKADRPVITSSAGSTSKDDSVPF